SSTASGHTPWLFFYSDGFSNSSATPSKASPRNSSMTGVSCWLVPAGGGPRFTAKPDRLSPAFRLHLFGVLLYSGPYLRVLTLRNHATPHRQIPLVRSICGQCHPAGRGSYCAAARMLRPQSSSSLPRFPAFRTSPRI